MKALLKGHSDVVAGLTFSPDSRLLISGGTDKTAILWDVEAQTLLHRLEGHRGVIYAVGFTPDGQRAVTESDDRTLRIWHVADGALIKELTGHRDKVRSLAVSPKDGSIASGDRSGEIRLWDGQTGALKKVFAHQGGVVGSLRFSPDGRLLLSTCGFGGSGCSERQRVFDSATGAELSAYAKHDNTVLAGAFTPDGRLVATGGFDGDIQIWDPKTGKTKTALKGTGRPRWAVGFSADGHGIAWGNALYELNRQRGYSEHINDRGPLEMAFHLPGADAALGEPQPLKSAKAWVRAKASSGTLSLQHREGGDYGYDAILYLLKDGKPSGVSIKRATIGLSSYSFTPDGKQIVSGGGSGVLTAYGLDGKKLSDFVGHESEVWAVAASPDGRYLVSGSADQTVRLWNLKTRELLVTIFRGVDGEWAMWTPEGFYTGSSGADKIVGWQINQGPDEAARYITAGQLHKVLHRPDLVVAKINFDPEGRVREAAARLNLQELLRSSLAPEVAILSPEDGAMGEQVLEGTRTSVRVTVKAHVTDTGGGIGKIVFRLNGQAVGAPGLGALALDKDGTISRTFSLGIPDATISVEAEDRARQILSTPATVTVHADPKALAGIPDLYVLAIGVNRYHDRNINLKFAVSDAGTLAETLKAAGKGYYGNTPTVLTLANDDVTPEKLGAAFDEFSHLVKANDVFVFYIAGHGKTLRNSADYYFLPPDVTDFSDAGIAAHAFGPDKLSDWFTKIPALKSIWIFDTCESGAAEHIAALSDAIRVRSVALDDAALQRLKDATGRTIFMAAAARQAAIEGYGGHGHLTYALLEGLAKAGSADKIQLYDLADYVQVRVPELSRESKACDAQTPQEYCQKPIVRLGSTPNYPLVPRYPAILAKLVEDVPAAPEKPTYLVRETAALLDRSGAPAVGEIKEGEWVAVVRTDGDLVQISQDGKVLGYLNKAKLLKPKSQ